MLWYKNDDAPRELVSYWTLRKAVGIMGASLPVLLVVGCFLLGGCEGLEDSISDYYGTRVRDVFVGILFAIAWFMFAYRGYDSGDDFYGDLACVFALGVALFPTTSETALIRAVHFVSASGLFLVLSYFSLKLFTKGKEPFTAEKKKRNKLYRACGVIMLVCIGAIPLYYLLLRDSALAALKPVFWLEAFALAAFGVSWLTKGEMILADANSD